ncbi:MAG: hypothetical protein WAK57_12620 [Desulfobacterales bacterium]|jgi:hypothetical protein
MKKQLLRIALVLVVVGSFAGTGLAAEVSQGKVIQTSLEKVTIEEYDINFSADAPYGHATGIVTEFELKKAKVGIPPEPGDIVRIAYVVEGDNRMALKVMNVSKQDLRKK